MKITKVELRLIRLEMKKPFKISSGELKSRETVIVKAYSGGLTGYGESPAFPAPFYSYETDRTCLYVLKNFLVPQIINQEISDTEELWERLSIVRGHNFAKSGLEGAFYDLLAKSENKPLHKILGGVKKEAPAGVSIGIQGTIDELLKNIEFYLNQKYRRVKIKIKPGWDVNVVKAIRNKFKDIVLTVDANSAYTLKDADVFRELDEYNLQMIEQPLGYEDIFDHAKLQRQIKTPICLDESIHGIEDARHAIELGSCGIINIKLSRVGGLLQAKKIHDLCLKNNIPVWCGGMLASGVGQAHKIAIASLPNFTLPNDIAPWDRFFVDDIVVPPVKLKDNGMVAVSDLPGIGWEIDEDKLTRHTISTDIV